jgi:hypothetical protein
MKFMSDKALWVYCPSIVCVRAVLVITVVVSVFVANISRAQPSPAKHGGNQDDCTLFMIEQGNDNTLTVQEKIAVLNGTLLDSVDRYDTCVRKMTNENENEAGAAGGSAGGSAASTGSTTSSEVKNELENSQPLDQNDPRKSVQQETQSGSIPKDIPSADNDSVLQRQIRAAAINETDPEKKKKLWDLYRKYMK